MSSLPIPYYTCAHCHKRIQFRENTMLELASGEARLIRKGRLFNTKLNGSLKWCQNCRMHWYYLRKKDFELVMMWIV